MGPLAYADSAALPEDGRRYESIDGKPLETPSPSSAHQWVVGIAARDSRATRSRE